MVDEEELNLYRYYSKPQDLYEFEDTLTAKFFEWYDGFDENDYDGTYEEITESPRLAFLFVKRMIGRPFPALESVIAKDAKYAYQYAQNILDAPFPEGEAAIAKDANQSYFYSTAVLGEPFIKGEEAIKKSKAWSNHYYRKYPNRDYLGRK